MKRHSAIVFALLLAACSGTTEDASNNSAANGSTNGATNNVSANGATNGSSNNGGTNSSTNNGSSNNVTTPPPSASKAAFCAEISEAIRAEAATIEVAPGPEGRVLVDGEEMTLRQAVSRAGDGDTVVLADGTYTFPTNEDGGFTGVYITTPNVTLRSASGDADAVVIDSNYRDHGNGSAPITIAAPGVTIADLTVKRSIYHLVHLWEDGDQATLHNLRLVDGGQQFVKSSGGDGTIDEGRVTCSEFVMTDAGRDNVWGYGAQDGNTTCYTGGIDSHEGAGWTITDNTFRGIYCDATGVQRPAHGMNPGARGDQTYNGGLAEHAIHMWDSPQGGGGHLIARNHIIDCARGIGLGFRVEVYDDVVRDNMIFSSFAGSGEHDVGISVERGQNTTIEHNTVFFAHPDAYPSTIEYRFDSSAGLRVANNLVSGQIRARDGADATLEGNVEGASAEWFVDGAAGDLHLANCDIAEVAGAAAGVSSEPDFDHDVREGGADVGADECE